MNIKTLKRIYELLEEKVTQKESQKEAAYMEWTGAETSYQRISCNKSAYTTEEIEKAKQSAVNKRNAYQKICDVLRETQEAMEDFNKHEWR